ncbi:histidine kinase [Sphaerisporangium rufum]|uniref:histidine kinase n=1 Tax=Sphaerisporangium rufum TaxID=1381558 RepID=A0A919R342_9ACTN|nr:sensor histidine kinase [Sphaerisporangium rufum]GII78831.1 histidine kinase [Sphaerisporangium rufum]
MSVPGYGRRARWPRLSTRAWFGGTMAIMFLLAALSAAAGGMALSRTSEATELITRRLTPALLAAERLRGVLQDQRGSVHGYVLTGDPGFLASYREGRTAEQASAEALRRTLAGHVLLADLDTVGARVTEWRAGYADPSIAAVGGSGPGAVSTAGTARGRVLFEGVRAALDAQAENLTRARTAALRAADRATMWRDAVFVAILATVLLTLISVAVLLRYVILGPLDRLGSASRRVAGGDFGHVIDVRGPADITMLALDVDAIRRRITAELDISRDAERRLREQTDLLRTQAEELRRSNAELEQFAYVASHDLQEPVRKVTAFCQLLQRRYAGRLDERADEYIAFAIDGAKRMQTLVSELLTFSRVGREQAPSERVPLDEPLEAALADLTRLIEESGAVVERPALPEVVGDPGLLTMLWQNLLGNAIKFRAPDRAPKVGVGVRRAGDMWEVTVTDNGIGVEPRFAEKIFVIFQRLHGRGDYDGTGIGLALCKKIVEYHGGEIRLDTGAEQGARFVFTLPAADGPAGDLADRAAGVTRAPARTPADPG